MRLLVAALVVSCVCAVSVAEGDEREIVERELTDKGLANLVQELAAAGIQSLTILDSPALRDISPLSGLPTLRTLRLDGVSIPELGRLNSLGERLESLSVAAIPDAKTLATLRMRTLKHLTVRRLPLVDLTGLDKLPALESLEVADVALESLAGLEGAPKLRRLTIQNGGTRPIAAAALKSAVALEELRVANAPVDAAFGPALAGLVALERLHLTRCGLAAGFGIELAGLVKLRSLTLDVPEAAAEIGPLKALLKCELRAADPAHRVDAKTVAALVAHTSLKWLVVVGGVDDAAVEALGQSRSIARLDVTTADPGASTGISEAVLTRARTRLEANPRFVPSPATPAHVIAVTAVGDHTLYAAPTVVVGTDGDFALLRANGAVVPPIEAIGCDLAAGKILWRHTLDPADACRLVGQIAVVRLEAQRKTSLVRASTGEIIASFDGTILTDGQTILAWENKDVTVYDGKTAKVLWKRPRDTLGWPNTPPTVMSKGVAVFLDDRDIKGVEVVKLKRQIWQVSAPKVKDSHSDVFRRNPTEWVVTDKAFYVLADRTFIPNFDGVAAGFQQIHAVVLATGEFFPRPLPDETTLRSMKTRALGKLGEYIMARTEATNEAGKLFHRFDIYDFLLEPKGLVPWSRYRQVTLVGKQQVLVHDSEDTDLPGVMTLRGKPLKQAKYPVLLPTTRAYPHPLLELGVCPTACRCVQDRGRMLQVLATEAEGEGPAFTCPPELATAPYFNVAITDDRVIYADERGLVVIDPVTMGVELEYPLPGGRLAQVFRAGPRWLVTDTLGRLTVITPGATITGR